MNYERPAAEGRLKRRFSACLRFAPGCNYDVFKGRHSAFLFLRRTCGLFSVFHLPAPAQPVVVVARRIPLALNVSRHVFVYFFSISLAPAETNFVAVAKVQMGKRIRFNLLCGVLWVPELLLEGLARQGTEPGMPFFT